MDQRLLAEWGGTPSDNDYVSHFQDLARVNLEIDRYGPNLVRLLRKAVLEMDVGNHTAGLRAAEDAAVLQPTCGEAHFLSGLAHVLLAAVRAEAIEPGPGMGSAPLTVDEHLLRSMRCWEEVLRLNPDDGETKAEMGIVASVLRAEDVAGALKQRIRSG